MADRPTVPIGVMIAPDLSQTRAWRGAVKPVDAPVADIVEALQAQGITMRGSCCGHQHGIGEISLQDGRSLLVVPVCLRYWEVVFSLRYRNEEPLEREAYHADIPPPKRPRKEESHDGDKLRERIANVLTIETLADREAKLTELVRTAAAELDALQERAVPEVEDRSRRLPDVLAEAAVTARIDLLSTGEARQLAAHAMRYAAGLEADAAAEEATKGGET